MINIREYKRVNKLSESYESSYCLGNNSTWDGEGN
jgi:hypothetical protein